MTSPQWLWIDFNAFNCENSKIYSALKLHNVKIERFNNYQELLSWVSVQQKSDKEDVKVCFNIICSASLPEDTYKTLLQSEKVGTAILYCMNLQKGWQMVTKYQRIQKVFISKFKLIDYILAKQVPKATFYHRRFFHY